MKRSVLERRLGTAALFLLAAGFGLCAPAALGADGVNSAAGEVTAAFSEAMRTPLGQRPQRIVLSRFFPIACPASQEKKAPPPHVIS